MALLQQLHLLSNLGALLLRISLRTLPGIRAHHSGRQLGFLLPTSPQLGLSILQLLLCSTCSDLRACIVW